MPDILADIPCGVLGQVQRAFRTFHTWNDTIKDVRRAEALAGAPGRYEYDIRYGSAGAGTRMPVAQAHETLRRFESEAVTHGVDPEAVYAALGGKPALLPEGPYVHEWHPSTREPA